LTAEAILWNTGAPPSEENAADSLLAGLRYIVVLLQLLCFIALDDRATAGLALSLPIPTIPTRREHQHYGRNSIRYIYLVLTRWRVVTIMELSEVDVDLLYTVAMAR
jgi:hypothetical protein